MSFQNILVPTDGSEFTKAAVAKAFDLAEVAGGRVTALYVKDKYATDESAKAAVGTSVTSIRTASRKDMYLFICVSPVLRDV